jgi:tripartite-type tricarboxylate transporter receptor subunit TctC
VAQGRGEPLNRKLRSSEEDDVLLDQRLTVAGSILLVAALCLAAPPSSAAPFDEAAVASFYKDKRVRIIVGYGPGGGYDTWGRLLSRHMGRHIPGNPTLIVENRPGAGALIAANAVYNSEPQDGTVIGTFTGGLVLQQALRESRVKFDARRFQWIGAGESTYSACIMRTDAGINGMDDLMKGKTITMASQAPGNMTYDLPAMMNASLGTKFKIISGYSSVPEMFLALRNGEASGICIGYVSVILATQRELLAGNPPLAKPFVITGDRHIKEVFLDGVPGAEALAKTPEAKARLKVLRLPQQITFPFAMGPGVPKDRVEAMRAAFTKTIKDPAFLTEAKRAGQQVDSSNGQEVAEVVNELLSIPSATIDEVRKILKQ